MKLSKRISQFLIYLFSSLTMLLFMFSLSILTASEEKVLFDNAHLFKSDNESVGLPIVELSINKDDLNSDYYHFFEREYNSNEKFYIKSTLFSTSNQYSIKSDFYQDNKKDIIGFSLIENNGVLNSSTLIKLSSTADGSFNGLVFPEDKVAVVLSNDYALLLSGKTSITEAIGQQFSIFDNNIAIDAVICGTYDSNYYSTLFHKSIFGTNFDNPLFFLKNEASQSMVTNKSFLTLSSDQKVNKSIYNDLQLLRSKMPISVSIPDLNSNHILRYANNSFFMHPYFSRIPAMFITGVILIIVSIASASFIGITIYKKKVPINLVVLFSFIIVLPVLILFVIKKITLFGPIISIVSPVSFWFAVVLSIIIVTLMTAKLFRNDQHNLIEYNKVFYELNT